MTVAEFIEELRAFPEDLPVHIGTHEDEFDTPAIYEAEANELMRWPRRVVVAAR